MRVYTLMRVYMRVYTLYMRVYTLCMRVYYMRVYTL